MRLWKDLCMFVVTFSLERITEYEPKYHNHPQSLPALWLLHIFNTTTYIVDFGNKKRVPSRSCPTVTRPVRLRKRIKGFRLWRPATEDDVRRPRRRKQIGVSDTNALICFQLDLFILRFPSKADRINTYHPCSVSSDRRISQPFFFFFLTVSFDLISPTYRKETETFIRSDRLKEGAMRRRDGR